MSLRDAYKQKLTARVEEQRAKLSLMKAHAKRVAADSRIVTYEEMGQAERSLGRLTAKLKKIAGAGLHALGDVKGGMGKALDNLNVSSKKAASRLQEAAAEPAPKRAPVRARARKPRPVKHRVIARKMAPKKKARPAKRR
ncbi:MAG TPA: hypothetical protein VHB20_00680 [Verrucomicrobiae bacterium]|jgi:hypothetical protein|nr:hypothetical protein [Verrucomicrobiae bacterium]